MSIGIEIIPMITKHQEFINKLQEMPITETNLHYLESRIDDFIYTLQGLNVEHYLTPDYRFNEVEWKLHDDIMMIYRTYSSLYSRCMEVLCREFYDYKLENANRLLERYHNCLSDT